MKYKFVKYRIMDTDGKPSVSNWVFVQETAEQVYDFFMKYTLAQNTKYKDKIIDNLNDEKHIRWAKQIDSYNNHYTMYGGHPSPTSHWEVAHATFMGLFNKKLDDPMDIIPGTYDYMTAQMLVTRLDLCKKGYVSYIDKDAMVSRVLTDIEIVDTVETDILEFPKDGYNLDDAKFLQWPGGHHWYVKINNEDVVVNGVQKWNSKEEAKEATIQYINNQKIV